MRSGVGESRLAGIVARLRAGVSPVCEATSPGPSEFGVLTLAAVTSGDVGRHNAKRIDASRVKPDWPVVRKGTVLVARGSGSRDKVGACVVVRRDEPRLIPPDTAWIVEVADGRSAQVLVEYLRSPKGRKSIHEITRGSNGIWKISQGDFLALALPAAFQTTESHADRIATSVQRLLEAFDALLSAKRVYRAGLMQHLLLGRTRFSEFRGRPWPMLRLDALCEELSERNGRTLGPDDVMGVIKDVGFEPMRARVRGKGDFSRYKVVPPGAFAYNPMRLNIGSIAYNTFGRPLLVSPDYEVFRVREGVADPDYVNQLRYSAYWASFMKRAGAGSVRVRIYFSDLGRLTVPAPKADEQQRIAQALALAGREIDVLTAQREKVETYFRGLLSRLLSGELPVPP